jgi:hypothetical protein
VISMSDIIDTYSENTSTGPPPTQKRDGGGIRGYLSEVMCGIGLIIIALFIMSLTGIGGVHLDTSNPLMVVLVFGVAILLIIGGCLLNRRKS